MRAATTLDNEAGFGHDGGLTFYGDNPFSLAPVLLRRPHYSRFIKVAATD